MKSKSKTKSGRAAGRPAPKPAPTPSKEDLTTPPAVVSSTPGPSWPSPDELLDRAVQEPNILDLRRYRNSILVLRSKGYSFREIAEWLLSAGVETNHSAVYRVYKQGMDGTEQAAIEAIEERRASMGLEEDE